MYEACDRPRQGEMPPWHYANEIVVIMANISSNLQNQNLEQNLLKIKRQSKPMYGIVKRSQYDLFSWEY